jgi:hypothetical protein
MKLVNLTPHAINLADENGQVVATIPPSGMVARVAANQQVVGSIELGDGKTIQVVQSVFGQPEGLPEKEEGTVLVVSSLVAQVAMRDDLLAPDTGPTAVRDGEGRILAVRRFQKF